MTQRTTRLLRTSLAALILGVGLLVAHGLRPPPSVPSPPTPPSAAPSGTRMDDLVYRQVREGKESLLLRARKMLGRQEEELRLAGVDVTLSYTARGKPGTANIVSDECIYTPTLQKAVFQGHVKLRTDDGFEVTSDQLIYRGDKGLARSEYPVLFKRKDVSGSSTGIVYEAEEGKLQLLQDVVVRIDDEKAGPTEIHSRRAVLQREEGTLRFEEDVEVTQGSDRLKAGRLVVDFGEDQTIYRALAAEGVDLQTVGGRAFPGTTGQAGGTGGRHLVGRKLDIWFRPDRTLQEATAGPEAVLTVLSGPGEAPERRRLEARFLTFRFDARGRLEEVQGQKDSLMRVEPLPPAQAAPRLLTCQGFVARMEPATGEITTVEFNRDVEFVEGTRKAKAQKAWFEGPRSLLILKDGPELVDEAEGSRLSAQAIDLGTRSGDIAARHGVRHVLRRQGGRSGLLGGRDEPALLSCRFFDYEAQARTAKYREGALLRSGSDEVRAQEIRLTEARDGSRRLAAEGGVTSILNPRPSSEGGKPPSPVIGRARQMIYDESANRVAYTGEAFLRQGEVSIKSPEATVTLTADGSGVETLVAGEPVEIQQGDRRATGTRATYTPGNETMVLVGDKVVLKDPSQEIQGRSLTFHVGDDRILVDGREEVRTQTIIRKEPPKP